MTTEQNAEAAPVIASPDDIDQALASRAYSGTSFSPERRGQQQREEYAEDVNGFYADLWPLAKSDEQKALLAQEMEQYRQHLLSMTSAYLRSHSGVVSTMIAGRSKFPARRMQKRGDVADKRLSNLIEWRNRARAAIKNKLLEARSDDAKLDDAWRRLSRDIAGSLGVILSIDEGDSFYTRSAFVNSIAGKVERLANNGEAGLVAKALELVRKYNESHKKPAISARHKFWTFGELANEKAAAHGEYVAGDPETLAEVDGVEIIVNPQADRVQIVFPSKQAAMAKISALKAEGWHWSRYEGAWQRKLTESAKASAMRIVGAKEGSATI